ncbi:hypothetical protein [Microseira sp. BLCC-F43]
MAYPFSVSAVAVAVLTSPTADYSRPLDASTQKKSDRAFFRI